MDLKKKMKILNITVWIVFLPILVGWIVGEELIMMVSCLLAILFAIAARRLWRCPHCDRHLGRSDVKITYCPHCGKHLGLD